MADKRFTSLEFQIDQAARALLQRLPDHGLSDRAFEFLAFGLKQAWSCLFGGLFLGLVLLSTFWWPKGLALARYDVLFFAAITIQAAMLLFKLEQPAEALVILVFHVVGTVMELFKTAHGSWDYPEPSLLRIAHVPLFSGFMYATVGSYIARASRIFDIQYSAFPRFGWCLLLAIAIYVNFFSHHYVWDLRYLLLLGTAALFWRTRVHYRVFRFRHQMPVLLGFALITLFIWLAENLGTWSRVWRYPNQKNAWAMVGPEKLGSWFLLMIISYVLVLLVHRPKPFSETSPTLP